MQLLNYLSLLATWARFGVPALGAVARQRLAAWLRARLPLVRPDTRAVTQTRAGVHLPHTLGERLADAVANGMGSWPFIVGQSAIVGMWIAVNLVAVTLRWDPYPFILLNLLFSTQAAYAAPIIMMSQNRQSAKDRLRDDVEADEVAELMRINREQMEMLRLLARLVPPATSVESPSEVA